MYVSNAQDGNIDTYAMDAESGDLQSLGKANAANEVGPMAISPDGRHLYAAVRSHPYCVLTYGISPHTGLLRLCARAPLPERVTYISVDASGRFLFSASYGGSLVAVSPIEETGAVESAVCHVIPTGKHAHAIRADRSNRFVYVPILGVDHIAQYLFDQGNGSLIENDPPQIETPRGSGPRHLAFSADGRHLYVLHEFSGDVGQFVIDPLLGTLSEIAYTATTPMDAGLSPGVPSPSLGSQSGTGECDVQRIWAADLQITPNGRFLYATERTTSRIALLSVATGSGQLSYVTNYLTEAQPRSIRIDPTGRFLVAAGQRSDRLSVYRIAKTNGHLSLIGRYPVGRDASWVEIVAFPSKSAQPDHAEKNVQ